MSFFWPKRLLGRVTALLALTLLLALGLLIRQAATIVTGYTAKCLCSEHFVAGREPAEVLAVDAAPYSRFVSTDIQTDPPAVEATFLGLVKARAVYRKGLGCALLAGAKEHEVRAQAGLRPPVAATADSWPPRAGGEYPALEAVLDRAFEDPEGERRTRAVLVLKDGELLAERYAEGFGPDTPLSGWSMTKTVFAALVGTLVREGALALDEPLPASPWPDPADPRRSIRLEDFLRQTSGLEWNEDYLNPYGDVLRMLYARPDTGGQAAEKPLLAKPGETFLYSSGGPNLVLASIRAAMADDDEYLDMPRRALFAPLGMSGAVFETDASGVFVGSSYLHATARDWARFGQLLLQDGVWKGQRLLPEGWVDWMTTPTEASGECYGAQVWINGPGCRGWAAMDSLPRDVWTARGHYGQYITALPSKGLLVLRFGQTHTWKAWDQEAFIVDVLQTLEQSY